MIRKDLPDRIYKTEMGKLKAVVKEVKERNEKGQPVLIGTISIEKNELLAEMLRRSGVKYEMLNAKNHEREAHIIAEAGQKGSVTLATNMAGRGTDIMLGGTPPSPEKMRCKNEYDVAKAAWKKEHDEVVSLGGLHVIGTERHESRRIDNQLRGRAGRQGDPGSSVFYVSAEDDLMRVFGGDRLKHWLGVMGLPDDEAIEHKMLSKSLESAQKRVEGFNFDARKRVVQYDDVLNRQREVIYRKRNKALFSKNDYSEIENVIKKALEDESRHLVGTYASGYSGEWNLDQLCIDIGILVGLTTEDVKMLKDEMSQYQSDTAIEQRLHSVLQAMLEQKKNAFGELHGPVLRNVYLNTIDVLWVEHLNTMQELRTGIGLQGYAQTDPLIAYKSEGYRLFQQLLSAIENQTLKTVFRVERVETTKSA
jgi:preprotein translocase subunit SecA